MNLDKISYELYLGGINEKKDKSIDDSVFPRVDTDAFVPADWVLNKSKVTQIQGNYKEVGDYAFIYCTSLTSVNLPVCEYVGDAAFGACSSLTSVNLPACSSIGNNAFAQCVILTNINLPVCTSIGEEAFLGCSNIEKINLQSYSLLTTSSDFKSMFNMSKLKDLTIGSPSIEDDAFAECESLTEVTLPVCSYVGRQAFYSCISLTSINLPVCTEIGEGAFVRCSSLTSVNLPVCSHVGDGAFAYCSSLTSINLPVCKTVGGQSLNGVKARNFGAFETCIRLTNIDLPVCESIGRYAFCDCESLTEINLPACTFIDTGAFEECESLESIYLTGSSVATLDDIDVFSYTPISDDSYLGHFGSIYVPASLLSQYQSAENWSDYSSRFVAISN